MKESVRDTFHSIVCWALDSKKAIAAYVAVWITGETAARGFHLPTEAGLAVSAAVTAGLVWWARREKCQKPSP